LQGENSRLQIIHADRKATIVGQGYDADRKANLPGEMIQKMHLKKVHVLIHTVHCLFDLDANLNQMKNGV